jgi:hypothetical protein
MTKSLQKITLGQSRDILLQPARAESVQGALLSDLLLIA